MGNGKSPKTKRGIINEANPRRPLLPQVLTNEGNAPELDIINEVNCTKTLFTRAGYNK